MFENLEILKLASGVTRHAATRQTVIARNIANVDTPGFKAQDIDSFADGLRRSDPNFSLRTSRAQHIVGGDTSQWQARKIEESSSNPNGNSVTLEREMVKGVDTRQRHQMALGVYKTSMDILRTSLGRR